MATTNLGRVAIVAQGEYNPSTQYEKLDIVRYAGVSYLVLRAVKGVAPTDGVDYSLLAGRGESAYEVAVDNGYIGTEQEWLAYIKADGSIQALQQFMTNDASTEVSVPDYGNIPSLQGYISTMFENGGLPAVPFKTKALMTASALVDGKYAMVTDDTVANNNGLYVKTAGAWAKSKYDPIHLMMEKESLLHDIEKFENMYISPSTGGEVTGGATGFSATEYIPVLPNTNYKILAYDNNKGAGSAWFDRDKVFISGFHAGELSTMQSPANAEYLRLSYFTNRESELVLSSEVHNSITTFLEILNTHGLYGLDRDEFERLEFVSDKYIRESLINSLSKQPTLLDSKVIKPTELNKFYPTLLGEAAYPIGRRVYDQSLRREVIADGATWRLPDGTSAAYAENRVYVYPDWFESKRALPSYAKKYSELFKVDTDTFSLVNPTKSPNISAGINYDYGEPRLRLTSSNGTLCKVRFPVSNTDLHSYLCFDLKNHDYKSIYALRVSFLNASNSVVHSITLSSNFSSVIPSSGEAFGWSYDYTKQLVPLKGIIATEEITQIELYLQANAGMSTSVLFSDIVSASFMPKITMRFDDATKSVFDNAYPALKKHGFKALTAVIANNVINNNADTMTVAQLKEIGSEGWDLVSHTMSHPAPEGLTASELREEFRLSQNYLRDELESTAIASSCLVPPFNRSDARYAAIAREFYDCVIWRSFINSPIPDQPGGHRNSASNWAAIGSFVGDNISSSDSLIAMAESVIATEGWGSIMMHTIDEVGIYSTDKTAFSEFCDWLDANRDRIEVVTVSDVVRQIRPDE